MIVCFLTLKCELLWDKVSTASGKNIKEKNTLYISLIKTKPLIGIDQSLESFVTTKETIEINLSQLMCLEIIIILMGG